MDKKNFISWTLESAIQIALLFLAILISFLIFKPFLILTVWAIILAVAFYPVFSWFRKIMNGKSGLAAGLISLLLLGLVIFVSVFTINKLVDNITFISHAIKNGSLIIPMPNESIKDWPLIGPSLYSFWEMTATNFEAAIVKLAPQLKEIAEWLLQSAKGLIGSVFISIFAIIIAGLLLKNADSAYSFSIKALEKVLGERAKSVIDNSRLTIQSVVKGVLGVAIIQSMLVGIGLWAVGIPGASLFTLIVFVLSLIQLPPIIIVLPIIVYVFSKESTTIAIIFTIYELMAGASDNFLKPMLLGRGLAIPMLVILIGAIGGMILMGMIGLFIGPVIFALSYQLIHDWVRS